MRGYRPSQHRDAVAFDKDVPKRLKKRGGVTNARLTEDDVRWVRANARANGGELSYNEMAERLRCTVSNIKCIVCRVTWKEVM